MKKYDEKLAGMVSNEVKTQVLPVVYGCTGIMALGFGVIGCILHSKNKKLDEQNELVREQLKETRAQNASNIEVLNNISEFLENINIQVNTEYDTVDIEQDDETGSEDSGDNKPENK